MNLKTSLVLSTLVLLFMNISHADELHKIVHVRNNIYEVQYDCSNKGYLYFSTHLDADTGSVARVKPFHQETSLPKECQPTSINAYNDVNGVSYDRGHGVSSNAWDDSTEHMTITNSTANIVPQESKLNRHGPWRQMEVLENCVRNIEKGGIDVIGGAIYSFGALRIPNTNNTIPDFLWKIIIFNDSQKTISLLVPNTSLAGTGQMKSYITNKTTIIEKVQPEVQKFITANDIMKFRDVNTETELVVPKGCNKN